MKEYLIKYYLSEFHGTVTGLGAGVIFLIAAVLLWKLGASQGLSRGIAYALIGGGLFFTVACAGVSLHNRKMIQNIEQQDITNNSETQISEIARMENVMKSSYTGALIMFSSCVVIGLLFVLVFQGNLTMKGVGLGLLLFGAYGHFTEAFSMKRNRDYLNELKMLKFNSSLTINTVTVTEVSDLVCPWCYIGKSFLDEAIEQLPDVNVQVRRISYLLRDDIPENGIDLMQYIKEQLGGYNRKEAHHEAALKTRNARIANYKWLANPMNAHRCLVYVRNTLGWEAEHEALGCLHLALYEDGKNISSVESCVETIAGVKGIDTAAAMEALQSNAFVQDVLDEYHFARQQLNVQSVPHFLIEANGKKAELNGAVNVEQWIKTINKLL
ncbi:MAG: DsbA family protein [Prevotellaceae bacterium]|jgi:predicted DsbA family dithiol-disulfide isomerase/lipoprotein signal peptidase|nr:DsbA family protein [Prevotellaceae bacterium]